MKKTVLIIISMAITLIFISTCCEKSTSPSSDTQHIGWVVGDREGGYGSIFKTTDGGQTWIRQGDSLMIPNVTLHAVRAIDSLTAWIVGDAFDGIGTILKTTDGGDTWISQAFSPLVRLYDVSFVNSYH